MATTKKKPAAKKPASKAPAAKKAAPTKSRATKHTPSAEHKAASAALKMVDEAAALLRKGISTGASTTEKARLEAKSKAHSLLNQASHSLGSLLGESTSALRKAINKL